MNKITLNDDVIPVLVTGGAGYIGSHTVYALIEAGYKPIVVDDLSRGDKKLLPNSTLFFRVNINRLEEIDELILKYSIKAIIHFAAYIDVEESLRYPSKYFDNNTFNTFGLVNIASQRRIPFIFSSTAAVYGEIASQKSVKESDVKSPINPYGASKLSSELFIDSISQAGQLDSVILRYFNVAGADPFCRTGQPNKNAGNLITRACLTGLGYYKHLDIYGDDYETSDGTCIRDYIHVCDLASAHVLALDYLMKHQKSEVFNCGYGYGYSVKEVIKSVERNLDRKLCVNIKARRAGDPVRVIADSEKIKNILKWQPQYENIDTIVKTALEWELKRESIKS